MMKAKKSNQNQQQILKKLSQIKTKEQLKNICKSLQSQNNTLRTDILDLKYKIQLLHEKNKTQKQYISKEDEQKSHQITALRAQLKQKYKLMQQLKKKRQVSSFQQGTQEINQQHINLINRIKIIDNQLANIKKQHQDITNQNKHLQKSVQIINKEQSKNQPKINQFSLQNEQLRKKISSMKKIGMKKEYESAKIMNSMYTIKDKYTKNQYFFQEIEKKKGSVQTIDKNIQSKMLKSKRQEQELSKQIEILKKQVKQVQKNLLKKDHLFMKRKQQLFQQNKKLIQTSKQLQQRKNKSQRQLNKNKKIWQKYIQYKNNNKSIKQYSTIDAQTEQFEDTNPLRREFAGFLGGKILFDDRYALKNNKKNFILGFIVYQMQHNATARHLLIGLRAIYDDLQANNINQIPIPNSYLSKCKTSKYMLVQGDFIKLFKIKYSSLQGRILKVQIRTNKNIKYQFGDKKPFNDLFNGQNVYAFDISIQEYPVCMFGSYNYHRSQWYLQSLGVQINQL